MKLTSISRDDSLARLFEVVSLILFDLLSTDIQSEVNASLSESTSCNDVSDEADESLNGLSDDTESRPSWSSFRAHSPRAIW